MQQLGQAGAQVESWEEERAVAVVLVLVVAVRCSYPPLPPVILPVRHPT